MVACTSIPAPDRGLIERKPVVRLGDAEPSEKGEYILRIPAGQPLPVRLHVGGSLFQRSEDIATDFKLTRDLYLYKYWASYNGRDWNRWGDMVGVEVSSGLGTKGAEFKVDLDTIGGAN
jgi:hypothetical protein